MYIIAKMKKERDEKKIFENETEQFNEKALISK